MKKKNVQRALALALAATMLAGTVAGCGKSSDSDSTQGGKSSNGKYAKELTIDVRRGDKGTTALLLNQVAVGAQLLDGAAHRNAAHVVLLG